jgi:uncharacterized protein YbjT (DUF2867 family)
MYAIMGITGQVGGAVARALLADTKSVRAIVRDASKGRTWADRGCEVAPANINDAPSLSAAFQGAEGVFLLVSPNFDPSPGFPEAQLLEERRPGCSRKRGPVTALWNSRGRDE